MPDADAGGCGDKEDCALTPCQVRLKQVEQVDGPDRPGPNAGEQGIPGRRDREGGERGRGRDMGQYHLQRSDATVPGCLLGDVLEAKVGSSSFNMPNPRIGSAVDFLTYGSMIASISSRYGPVFLIRYPSQAHDKCRNVVFQLLCSAIQVYHVV